MKHTRKNVFEISRGTNSKNGLFVCLSSIFPRGFLI